MKVLFDTNVLISAFVTHGHSNEVFEHCLEKHAIYISNWILDELREKLENRLGFPQLKVSGIICFIEANMKIVEPLPLNARVCRDKDDDNILSAALSAMVDCIITGDEDLLILKEFKGIRILRPSEFWGFEIGSVLP